MKVTDYVADFLAEQGVRTAYELVGGMITHLVDSIYQRGQITLVSTRHEQAAAFAADAQGRLTGIPGIAFATSGPGATNLLTGIGSCFFDSSPAIFITGQVNRSEQRGDRPIRQLGFQETDIVPMARHITKGAWRIETPEEVPARLIEAFRLALSGRPGPVLLDIPMDIQNSEITVGPIPTVDRQGVVTPAPAAIEAMLSELRRAERPLILVGGGVRAAGAAELFRQFVNRIQVPVVNSLLGVDVLPGRHPLRVGMLGSYGNRWANHAVARSDFLLVLGSRLDIRQTGADTAAFKEGRTIFHVDCEPGEINNRVLDCEPILADARTFLSSSLETLGSSRLPIREEWLTEIRLLQEQWPDTAELKDVPGINPNQLMQDLARVSQSAAAYVVDVGQHQMWAAQSLFLGSDQRFLTSGGMGAMGFSLPASVGAAFAFPGRPIVTVAGDGSFQLNIQELQTVAHHRLPVKIVILNNGCHGMVRQFQQSYFQDRYQSTVWGYSAPSFARVAEAYGIPSRQVSEVDDIGPALEALWDDPTGPFLLEVAIHMLTNVYPKIAFGYPLSEMEPFVKPIAMEGT